MKSCLSYKVKTIAAAVLPVDNVNWLYFIYIIKVFEINRESVINTIIVFLNIYLRWRNKYHSGTKSTFLYIFRSNNLCSMIIKSNVYVTEAIFGFQIAYFFPDHCRYHMLIGHMLLGCMWYFCYVSILGTRMKGLWALMLLVLYDISVHFHDGDVIWKHLPYQWPFV